MRILHTSDWHLGHRLYGHDRTREHQLALDWMLDTIKAHDVELLIVAGDVFDSMNPSNTARNLYYNFLARLQQTSCHSAVIVGGNHDSPTLLDAPARILSHLNVHIIGGARASVEEQLIPIYRKPGQEEPDLIVAAVPYLRDRDLKYSVIGETATDKVARMRRAIRQHYEEIGAAAGAMQGGRKIPIVGTGHLFASGSTDAEDKMTNIYLADRHNIEAGHFDPCFDYVALGHIHRAQRVGERDHVRYAGSIIPLTFGEARIPQSVCLVEVGAAGEPVTTTKITVPVNRKLHSLRGPVDEVKASLTQLTAEQRALATLPCCPWVEVKVETDHPLPLLREELQEIIAPTTEEENAGFDRLPRLLRTSTVRASEYAASLSDVEEVRDLNELEPEDVFHQLCHGTSEEGDRGDYPDLLATFRELRGWMVETADQE